MASQTVRMKQKRVQSSRGAESQLRERVSRGILQSNVKSSSKPVQNGCKTSSNSQTQSNSSNGQTTRSHSKLQQQQTQFAHTCSGCNKPIRRDKFLLKACEKFWHENCLRCDRCHSRLGELGSTLFCKANMKLCRQDYLEMFGETGICSVCDKLIRASEMVMRAKQNVYHLECFACQLCNQRFCVGDRFYLCENKVVCQYDYEEHILPIQKSMLESQAVAEAAIDAAAVGPTMASAGSTYGSILAPVELDAPPSGPRELAGPLEANSSEDQSAELDERRMINLDDYTSQSTNSLASNQMSATQESSVAGELREKVSTNGGEQTEEDREGAKNTSTGGRCILIGISGTLNARDAEMQADEPGARETLADQSV